MENQPSVLSAMASDRSWSIRWPQVVRAEGPQPVAQPHPRGGVEDDVAGEQDDVGVGRQMAAEEGDQRGQGGIGEEVQVVEDVEDLAPVIGEGVGEQLEEELLPARVGGEAEVGHLAAQLRPGPQQAERESVTMVWRRTTASGRSAGRPSTHHETARVLP